MAIETENAGRLPAHAGPHVRNLARYENGLTGTHAKSLITNLKLKLAINDVDPLILVVVQVARIAAEEKLLTQDREYQAYQQRVRWRLVPGLW